MPVEAIEVEYEGVTHTVYLQDFDYLSRYTIRIAPDALPYVHLVLCQLGWTVQHIPARPQEQNLSHVRSPVLWQQALQLGVGYLTAQPIPSTPGAVDTVEVEYEGTLQPTFIQVYEADRLYTMRMLADALPYTYLFKTGGLWLSQRIPADPLVSGPSNIVIESTWDEAKERGLRQLLREHPCLGGAFHPDRCAVSGMLPCLVPDE